MRVVAKFGCKMCLRSAGEVPDSWTDDGPSPPQGSRRRERRACYMANKHPQTGRTGPTAGERRPFPHAERHGWTPGVWYTRVFYGGTLTPMRKLKPVADSNACRSKTSSSAANMKVAPIWAPFLLPVDLSNEALSIFAARGKRSHAIIESQ